ncbi:MAG TPA: hypothetical protein VEC57_20970 [Candidatus Limnocylindrales bacterium]|nr:hypothetical protein [Candidatus Limnocylindrales bacterium]
MAEALMKVGQQGTGLSGPWGGIASALAGGLAGWQQRKAGQEQMGVDDQKKQAIAKALAGLGGDPAATAAIQGLPIEQQQQTVAQLAAQRMKPQELKWQDAGNELVGTNSAGEVVARVPKGVDPALRKTEYKDAGNKYVPFDPYAPNQQEITKSVTPDAKLSSETSRANAGLASETSRANAQLAAETARAGQEASAGKQSRRDTAGLRKEFRSLPSVKEYETALPIIETARKAPDTPAGDLQVIYSVGKVLDPNSVVREGELQLTQSATPFLQQMIGKARAEISGQGRLTPETRKNLVDMLDQRVQGYQQAYSRDFETYGGYARDIGADPGQVVGTRPETAFTPGGSPPLGTTPSAALASANGAPPVPQQAEMTATGPNGEKLVLRNGQWQPLQ